MQTCHSMQNQLLNYEIITDWKTKNILMFSSNKEKVLTEIEAMQLPPLTLAYIGDSVFDMYVRTQLIVRKAGNAGLLHRKSSKIVNASAQADFAHAIEESLKEKEKNIFMRGRNAKSATVPKNMSVADYRYATALEALLGFLFLTGQHNRLNDLLGQLDGTIKDVDNNGI